MATLERHSPTLDSKGGRVEHLHLLMDPYRLNLGGRRGTIGLEGTSAIVTLDGHDGHWHLDLTSDLKRILERLATPG